MDHKFISDNLTVENLKKAILAYFALLQVRLTWKILNSLLKKLRYRKLTQTLPRPEGDGLLLGSVKASKANMGARLDWIMSIFKNDSQTVSIALPFFMSDNTIITQDPAIVEHILKTNFNNYIKTIPGIRPINIFGELMGEGIFNVNHGPHAYEGEDKWYSQRKTASKIFTQHLFRDYFCNVFVNKGKQVLTYLDKLPKDSTIDIQEVFFRYTMDSFGQIGFGVDFNTVLGSSHPFPVAFDAAHASIIPFFIKEAYKTLFLDLVTPWPFKTLAFSIYRRTSSTYQSFKKQLDLLDKICYKIISDRRANGAHGQDSDLLTLFMKEDSSSSDSFLRDILLNFIIAGRDTTACTLSWTFFRLAKHPEVMEKLVREIDETLQGEEPNYNNIKPLKYLNGVVYEALRLHPPVPIDSKMAVKEDKLPNGVIVPPYTRVAFFPWGMGRNQTLWDKPSEFLPERWMEGEGPSAYKFPVFQAGPRICLGKDMAILEAKLLIVILLQKYKFDLIPGQTGHYTATLTMSIKGGLKVIPKPRVASLPN